jgi:hypothetical protein
VNMGIYRTIQLQFAINPTDMEVSPCPASRLNSGYGRELSELGIGEFVNRKLICVADVA